MVADCSVAAIGAGLAHRGRDPNRSRLGDHRRVDRGRHHDAGCSCDRSQCESDGAGGRCGQPDVLTCERCRLLVVQGIFQSQPAGHVPVLDRDGKRGRHRRPVVCPGPECDRVDLMKSKTHFALLVTVFLVSSVTGAAEPSLIPWPVKLTSTTGSFTVDAQTTICAAGDTERAIADQLQAVVKKVQGLDLKARGCGRGGIALKLSSTAAVENAEGYTL